MLIILSANLVMIYYMKKNLVVKLNQMSWYLFLIVTECELMYKSFALDEFQSLNFSYRKFPAL